MLTPQEIQMANQATGNNVPLDGSPVSAPVQSRADQIRALGKKATTDTTPKLGQGAMGDFAGNVVRTVAEPLLNIGGGIQKVLTGGKATNTGIETAQASKEQHAGGVAGTLGDIVGTIAPYFTGAGEAKAGTALAEKVAPFISGLAEHLGMTTESLLPKIASYVAKNAPEVVTNTAIGTAQTGSPTEGLAIGAGGLVAKEALGAIPKIPGIFKGKTVDEILATPENKLAGLSSEDRKVYFDAQRTKASEAHTTAQDAITQKHTQLETQIKAEGEKKIADLNNQTQTLVNQADRASINEAQALKPKVIKAMGENSKTYRELIDKEIAPVRNERVAHADLVKYITERNPDNPALATEISRRLGLDTGATITNKSSTVGEIYDQLKGLKQDIGGAGVKGTRVFTPDEIKTTDAIATLSDYLKTKGIDFTEANKFWSQYAPLRDKLIKNIQPFTPAGAESGTFGTFTKDIQNYIRGTKEGKVDFITATEKLLGTKIGNSETRSALERLSANEKAQFATKLEQENKLSDAKLLRDQQVADAKGVKSATEKGIADKEFEANRQAQTRKNIIKTLSWITGGAIGLEELKRLTGM
jgi:hypothetical protein